MADTEKQTQWFVTTQYGDENVILKFWVEGQENNRYALHCTGTKANGTTMDSLDLLGLLEYKEGKKLLEEYNELDKTATFPSNATVEDHYIQHIQSSLSGAEVEQHMRTVLPAFFGKDKVTEEKLEKVVVPQGTTSVDFNIIRKSLIGPADIQRQGAKFFKDGDIATRFDALVASCAAVSKLPREVVVAELIKGFTAQMQENMQDPQSFQTRSDKASSSLSRG